MNLADYFAGGAGRQAALCRLIDAHAPDVSRWASGARPVPLHRCLPIERCTGGLVRRWELRPDDWHLIWPEVVGTEGAPPVPEAAATQPTGAAHAA